MQPPSPERKSKLSPAKQLILEERRRGINMAATHVQRIGSLPRPDRLPLSFAQQRLWFLVQMKGASEAYHLPMGWRFKGELDGIALRRALNSIVVRHEALRTVFDTTDGEPLQRIMAPENCRFHL